MVMERGRKTEKKNLEIIQCHFPLGDPAENSVLTPNDKKHQAGVFSIGIPLQALSISPSPSTLGCSLALTGLCMCMC